MANTTSTNSSETGRDGDAGQAAPAIRAGAASITATRLKERFGPQKIPSAADFGALIDMADAGYKAVMPNPGPGLQMSTSGLLGVRPGKGLQTVADGSLAVKIGAGLETTGPNGMGELQLKVGAGLKVGGLNSVVEVKPGTALRTEANGALGVHVGPGMRYYSGEGLAVNLGTGLQLNQDRVEVRLGNSLRLTEQQKIEVRAGAGLEINPDGFLGINAGPGLEFTHNNRQLQIPEKERIVSGMMALWGGPDNAIPPGWSKVGTTALVMVDVIASAIGIAPGRSLAVTLIKKT